MTAGDHGEVLFEVDEDGAAEADLPAVVEGDPLMIRRHRLPLLLAILVPILFVGCPGTSSTGNTKDTKPGELSAVDRERAKLSPEDRALVEAQEWCAVNEKGRLGSMGPPVKLELQGETVFLCCSHCEEEAKKNPEKTLAEAKKRKEKVKAEGTHP